jgi:pimeloyl-ACP methyl ester carboxylesterase
MENCRWSLLFLCVMAMITVFSVPVYAETVEEKKSAANYDESFPAPEEVRATEEVPSTSPSSAPVQSAQAVAQPIQETSSVTLVASPVIPTALPVPPNPPVETMASATAPAIPQVALPKAEGIQTPGTVPPVPAGPQGASKDMPEDQVFATANPSGLVEVSGYKYPVFLFAPKDYKTDRTYAMIMIAPAESAKAEKQIEYLTGLAQRKSIFILAPYVLWPKAGDTPYRLDEWLLTVKRDVMERFPISKKRVYLVGKDLGAHYAAYMAIKYPKEFSAVALLGQAWDGPFAQLVDPHSDAADQVPFYVALKAGGEVQTRNQVWFDKLQQKGYPLHLVDYKGDEELDDLEFKKSVFDWLEATGQSWEASVDQAPKNWKGKFKKGVKDFFAV